MGHGGAIGALWWIASRPGTDTGGWLAARSWAIPGLAASTAKALAVGFWIVAMVGFLSAGLAYWGIVVPADWWRPVAVFSAVVSLIGIGLFAGTWPFFNTAAALIMNVAVLVAILWLRWPPTAATGG